MLRLSFLIIFSILSFTFACHGQMCGNGFFKIEVSGKQEVNYTLYSLTPKGKTQFSSDFRKWLNKTFKIDENDKELERVSLIHNPFEVKHKLAKKFLNKYKSENFETPPIIGVSQNRIIQFSTGEASVELYLLKVSSDTRKNTKYFIQNYLGGCRRFQKINVKE